MSTLSSIPRPLVIGHRGYSRRYPENTLISFEAAYAAGAAMIELDVTLSRDREVVVMHDAAVDRTTDGKGSVQSHTLESLKKLDAGSWFNARFAGQRIPTLTEVLETFSPHGLVNVEIKAEARENGNLHDGIEQRVWAILQKYDAVRRVLISSFDVRMLERIGSAADPPALGILTDRHTPPNLPELCRQLRAFSWHPHQQGLDPRQVAAVREAGVRVFPYTANAAADIRRLLRMGVDGFFTDDPAAALKCVEEMKSNASIV